MDNCGVLISLWKINCVRPCPHGSIHTKTTNVTHPRKLVIFVFLQYTFDNNRKKKIFSFETELFRVFITCNRRLPVSWGEGNTEICIDDPVKVFLYFNDLPLAVDWHVTQHWFADVKIRARRFHALQNDLVINLDLYTERHSLHK